MLPATYNITLYQGDSWTRWLTLEDAQGMPVPLGEWQIRGQVRSSHGATAVLAEFEVTLDPETPGRFCLSLSPAATAQLKPALVGDYVYDLEFTDTLGRVSTYLRGTLGVLPDVTRDD